MTRSVVSICERKDINELEDTLVPPPSGRTKKDKDSVNLDGQVV